MALKVGKPRRQRKEPVLNAEVEVYKQGWLPQPVMEGWWWWMNPHFMHPELVKATAVIDSDSSHGLHYRVRLPHDSKAIIIGARDRFLKLITPTSRPKLEAE